MSAVVGEVGSTVGAITALEFIEYRDMRLDPALVHEPKKIFGRAVGTVGGEPGRPSREVLLRARDHGADCPDLGLPDGAASLDVDDDGMVEVD